MTDLDEAVRRLAGAERLLVMSDFDGTLAPIADHPDRVVPDPGAIAALGRLAALPDTAAAIVSGRSLLDLRRFTAGVPDLILVGGHGAERGDRVEIGSRQRNALQRAVAMLNEIADLADGAFVEEKATSAALHVRASSPSDQERLLVRAAAGPGRLPGVRVIEGKQILEITVHPADKGSAALELGAEHPGAVSVFIGDDITDEHAFAALVPPHIGVKVGAGPTAAGFRLSDQAAVGPFLSRLAAARDGRIG